MCKAGVDDCDYYEVSKEQIEELNKICKEVIKKSIIEKGKVSNGEHLENGKWVKDYIEGDIISNPEVAEKLLPTIDGFFFGSTDYDEYYIENVKYTIEETEKILKEIDLDKNYVFYSSSW